LITKYKEAKEEEKRSKMQSDSSKLNADLNFGPRSMSQKGARANSMGMEEKAKRREQLREWQEKKLMGDNEARLERIRAEQEQKERERKRKERERDEKKALVEEFKYRKELDKQRAA
jgi:hypothetical protein